MEHHHYFNIIPKISYQEKTEDNICHGIDTCSFSSPSLILIYREGKVKENLSI